MAASAKKTLNTVPTVLVTPLQISCQRFLLVFQIGRCYKSGGVSNIKVVEENRRKRVLFRSLCVVVVVVVIAVAVAGSVRSARIRKCNGQTAFSFAS